LLASSGEDAWRSGWLAIGCASAIFAVLALSAARQIEEPANGAQNTQWPVSQFGVALGSYFLFGAGYIAYMTFVVAWMVSHGASALEVAVTWGTLGVATLISPLVWQIPRRRWHPTTALAAVGVVLAVGAAIPIYNTELPAMIVSALLFGCAMFTAPACATDLVKVSLSKTAWGAAVALFTVVFAVGQAIGPVLTGWLADTTHSLHAGLAASVAILLAASATALFQRESAAPLSSRQNA
jgi:predicted MFS family arabinose efflux permease